MFSNDKNVETIAQLVEVLKHYIGLQSEYMKLDALQTLVGSLIWAFLIVGGGYLLLLIFFILLRRSLIERPLVRFLGSLLMSK